MSHVERISEAGPQDAETWLHLRRQLWPRFSEARHREQMRERLDQSTRQATLLAARDDGWAVGFVELSLRDEEPGCTGSPVASLEGCFVEPECRRRGVARALLRAAEHWALLHGCRQLLSRTGLDDDDARAIHVALGFEPLEPAADAARWLRELAG